MATTSTATWPRELIRLATLRRDGDGGAETVGSIWRLLHSGLHLYLRLHASRLGWIDDDEMYDVASQKSLELLQKLDSRAWSVESSSAGEVKAFLSTIARNGLVDALRHRRRWDSTEEGDATEAAQSAGERSPAAPDEEMERGEFARALEGCVRQLRPQWRRVWFFRAFYELPSKLIAQHPEVQMKPGHVDVTLQRCREQITQCMHRQGFDARDLPAGCYAAVWEACRWSPETSNPEGFDG